METAFGWTGIIIGALGAAISISLLVVENRKDRGRKIYRAWMSK